MYLCWFRGWLLVLILWELVRFFFAEGKPIPTELRNEEAELRHQIDLEDESTAGMVFFLFIYFYFGVWFVMKM